MRENEVDAHSFSRAYEVGDLAAGQPVSAGNVFCLEKGGNGFGHGPGISHPNNRPRGLKVFQCGSKRGYEAPKVLSKGRVTRRYNRPINLAEVSPDTEFGRGRFR